MKTEFIASKLAQHEKSTLNSVSVGRCTDFGRALAIKFLESFSPDYQLTETEYKEYLRLLKRRQRKDEQFPLILI